MARPLDVMKALTAFLNLRLTTEQATRIVNGPAFTTHSKSGAAFGAAARHAEYDAAAAQHRDEIEKVLYWATMIASNNHIPMQIPQSLLP